MYDSTKVAVKAKGYNFIERSEEAHLRALDVSPISVCLDANLLRYYSSGVIRNTKCYSRVTHSVLMVGYGLTEDGVPYYLCRNSWGEKWGEKGYFRISRENTDDGYGVCGILYYSI